MASTTSEYAPAPNSEVVHNNSEHAVFPANDKTNTKLCVIAIIASIIIVTVIILAVTVEFRDAIKPTIPRSRGCDSGGTVYDYYLDGRGVNQICGDDFCDSDDADDYEYYCEHLSNATHCARSCGHIFEYDAYQAYYSTNITDKNATGKCYCYTYDQEDDYKYSNASNICFNVSNYTHVDRYWVDVYEIMCADDGRPYYVDIINKKHDHLIPNVKEINCNDYKYLNDPEWKEFMLTYNDSTYDMDLVQLWIDRGLAEYSAIGAFAKFTLELMSIGAPLWLIELSNQANFDEIQHAKISFDVANMFISKLSYKCLSIDTFPSHSINIDGDWNRIALDTAIGGCFGETIAALTINKYKYDNIIDRYVYKIAMDEINHASLAWITIKWIIDQNVEMDIDIANKEWWTNEIRKRQKGSKNDAYQQHIYDVVIKFILDKIWENNDLSYKQLYSEIVESLTYFLVNPSIDLPVSHECVV